MSSDPAPLRIVVLTSRGIGIEVAASLLGLPAVRNLTLVTTPLFPARRPLAAKLRGMYRERGLPGLAAVAITRVRHPRREPERERLHRLAGQLDPALAHLHFEDFHSPECLERVRSLAPDLGVVVATSILRPELFTIPRLGSVNLHFGKAPDYRGSSPGFWEMYNGETEVGVTVHRVTETLDGGHILVQECFPLDNAPAEDPLTYLDRYREEVLLANGIRLMKDAVARIAAGTCEQRPQDPTHAHTYRRATYRAKQELRRRVASRRATSSAYAIIISGSSR